MLRWYELQFNSLRTIVLGCWKPYCPVTFHQGCSMGQEVVNRHDIWMSSCWAHSRRQRPVSNVPGPPPLCGVCGWNVSDGVSFSMLVTICCNTKHHRDCIQVIAWISNRVATEIFEDEVRSNSYNRRE